MKQISFPKHEYQDLIKRLYEAGSMGADMSPGDELCNEAARAIEELLRKIQYDATFDEWPLLTNQPFCGIVGD